MQKKFPIYLVFGLALLSVVGLVGKVLRPAEDAAILYIYAKNLATHGIISFATTPLKPTEGATDFLWMVIIAAMNRVGVDPYLASLLLSVIALIASGMLLVTLSGPLSALRVVAACLAICFTPFFWAAVQGFSPLFYGATLLAVLWFFYRRRIWPLAITSLLSCLVRPDAVVIIGPLLISCLFIGDGFERKALIKSVISVLIIPGLCYFLWRYWYFGELFPLPFYVKSNLNSLFAMDSISMNIRVILKCLPLYFVGILFLRPGIAARKNLVVILIAFLLCPFLFYSRMVLEQNICQRFQYPFFVGAISLAMVCRLRWRRLALALVASALLFLKPWATGIILTLKTNYETVPSLAEELAHLPKGRMAITEAGRLPWYSGWDALDVWGLNEAGLAKRVLKPDDIVIFNPDLAVIHAAGDDYSFFNDPNLRVAQSRSWENMTGNMYLALRDQYDLLMIPFETPDLASKPLLRIVRLLEGYRARTQSHPAVGPRYDAFFINRFSPLRNDLHRVLVKYGGVSVGSVRVSGSQKISQ